ncbi:hypothetical protein [Alteriqipengyuania lutimaris]|uniref:Lipoprotein n=1 Tax=Alteriqipengyuania lutimaris TaxID=1538146 RepID=A0A395LI19_9SPHN|nr:hypothetical protein [Alteriqipengyuania lutimaris]MBB3034879.1 hypothetical protein [Alteriqipengyuania lutimaris]RDS76289.1 hypothetical protein DL238_00765 [Alteriqipengyuania lutimaris]
MQSNLKVWTGLGLATALAGATLAGCADNGEAGDDADTPAQASAVGDGEGGEGEGGEGGESGEGGVSAAEASSDPVAYGSALAVAEAHAVAARDAYAAGRTEEAMQMFVHPISEVLADLAPVFEQLGVDDLEPLFTQAAESVQAGESQEQVDARYEAIVEGLRSAATKAPEGEQSDAMIAAGIISDQISRANAMYRISTNTGQYDPYLDGYGFYKVAEGMFGRSRTQISSADGELADRIEASLELLGDAYPGAERPESSDVEQSELVAAHNRIRLSL